MPSYRDRTFLLCVALLLLAHLAVFSDAGSNPEGAAFLEQNALADGVTVLDSGLQYKVLQQGNGTAHPSVRSLCAVNYRGTFINGDEFDSSKGTTAFHPLQVIEGWTQALLLMVEGDEWEIYVPSDLAYGDQGAGRVIPPGETLIFEIELVEIVGFPIPIEKVPATDSTNV